MRSTSRARTPWGWLAKTAAHRAITQWRPLLVVSLVALVVTTLLGTLTLLVTRTEQQAVHAALTSSSVEDRTVTVVGTRPSTSIAEVRERTGDGVSAALGVPMVAAPGEALSVLQDIPRETLRPALAWVASYDDLPEHAILLDGAWPADTGLRDGRIQAALPEAMARVLDVEVGSVVPSADRRDGAPLDLEVVGVFRRADPQDPWWDRDRIRGTGHLPGFPVPFSGGFVTTDLVGPVVVHQTAYDETDIEVASVTTRWTADLSGVGPDDLGRLGAAARLAQDSVADDMAGTVSSVRYSSSVRDLATGAAGALVVTRSGVVVVGLLLLVVAVATLSQSARLLGEARTSEHELMRARGASRGHLISAAALESVVLGGGAALVGTLASVWLHGALVGPTTLGSTAGLTLGAQPWLVAAGIALLVAVVGVTPLLGPADTFVESEQATARPERRAALARAGLDVVLVGLAAVAYWQLRTYGSPVRADGGGLTMDPVLVVGPSVVLVAATLLSLRLLPAISHLVERLAARGRGLVGPLAAWEIGRRSARAATAVLLLAVTVAVGTFTRSYLDTWSTSQDEQAAFSVGAPVVARPTVAVAAAPVMLAGPSVVGDPEPVLRDDGGLAVWSGQSAATSFGGRTVQVLAATAAARSMLDVGRVAQEGGAAVAALRAGSTDTAAGAGLELPADAVGLAGRVVVTSQHPLEGVGVTTRVLLEDAQGVVSSVALPHSLADADTPFELLLEGAIPPEDSADEDAEGWIAGARRAPLRVVGVQVQMVVRDESEILALDPRLGYAVDVELLDLAAVVPGEPDAGSPPPDSSWPDVRHEPLAASPVPFAPVDLVASSGNVGPVDGDGPGVRLSGTLDDLVGAPAAGASSVWPGLEGLPTVLSARVAERLDASPGSSLVLRIDRVDVRLEVQGVVEHVPTMAAGEHLVLDHTDLSRALVLAGSSEAPVDEWWVDVPADRVDAYLADLPDDAADRSLAETATSVVGTARDLREGPLRVALPLALWLVTAGAALVAALGFGVHTTMTLRSRDVELAQLRAVGLQRNRLVAVVTTEALIVAALGCVIGVAVGALLAGSVSPLVSVAADGGLPVPAVRVHIPWDEVALVVAAVVVVVAGTAAGVARRQRTADPAAILRAAAGR